MTTYEFGDVVLVPFPFSDQSATKKRPAVVISSAAYHRERPDLLLLAVTSRPQVADIVGERPIRAWKEAGLLKPSIVKPVIATIEATIVLRQLGRLTAGDRDAVHEVLDEILGK